MDPITLGIAALTALVLGACGSDGSGRLNRYDNDGDASTADAAGGKASTGGSGGAGGSGGVSGSGGSDGIDAGHDSGDMDGGMDARDSYVDASNEHNPVSVPYHFGMIYGSSNIQGVRGTGMLYFSDPSSCQLLGGSFDGELQSGGKVGISVDLTGNQSVDLCTSQASIPLAGGLFDGVSWMLTNRSEVLTSKQSYEITSCSSKGQDGGVENCSGALEKTNP